MTHRSRVRLGHVVISIGLRCDPVTLKIRAADAADVEAIEAVGHRTWPATYESFAGPEFVADGLARWWSREALLRTVRDTSVLVVERDGAGIVGMGNIDFRREIPVIWRLYVVPEEHGTGTGTALMTALLELASTTASAVQLEYMDGNTRAERFYRRHGFAEIRREPASEPGWPSDVWMEKRLDRRPEKS